MSTDWSPEQYEKFSKERRQPFEDLLGLVERREDMSVLDLGCGTGALTERLADSLGAAQVLGVDASEAMLQEAQSRARQGLSFLHADLQTWQPEGTWDLVFSNAALHWLPEHAALLRRLAGVLRPHGQLAIQVPANFDHPSHRLAETLAGETPYADALGGETRGGAVLSLREYAVLLHELGFARQHVRAQIYLHELPSAESVVEWTRGSTLTWYEQRLSADLFPSFLETYRTRLVAALGGARPYPYAFQRYLMWARR